MNFWDMSSPGIGLVVSIPNIVLSTRFMMILWPFFSPWGTIMQSKFIGILFSFYISKINDLTISSVYYFSESKPVWMSINAITGLPFAY